MTSESKEGPIVVLGIGNTIVGDDGIGPILIQRLTEQYDFYPEVLLVDGGTLGLQLLPIVFSARYLIVLDAYRNGLRPGTVSTLPLEALMERRTTMVSLHETDLSRLLAVAELIEIRPAGILIGVEPHEILPGESRLSSTVSHSLNAVIEQTLGRLEQLGVRHAVRPNRDERLP
jgi:hydrogenase maturation protease